MKKNVGIYYKYIKSQSESAVKIHERAEQTASDSKDGCNQKIILWFE